MYGKATLTTSATCFRVTWSRDTNCLRRGEGSSLWDTSLRYRLWTDGRTRKMQRISGTICTEQLRTFATNTSLKSSSKTIPSIRTLNAGNAKRAIRSKMKSWCRARGVRGRALPEKRLRREIRTYSYEYFLSKIAKFFTLHFLRCIRHEE